MMPSKRTLQTFREQQRKTGRGPYHFMRSHGVADGHGAGRGYGNPAKPVGLIYSIFRPSDDATVFPFLVPSNFFAMVSLRQAAEMVEQIRNDHDLAKQCRALADEVEQALHEYAIVNHPKAGRVYAFEVDAFGNYYCTETRQHPEPALAALSRFRKTKRQDLPEHAANAALGGESLLLHWQGGQRTGRTARWQWT